ncbi:hypothetical protein C8J57DRAFT_1233617 [Mycena rebaudengoi]|nr:hypothetical protein C8J57DRAFT_1233617 [Mycena rebaudengoi]
MAASFSALQAAATELESVSMPSTLEATSESPLRFRLCPRVSHPLNLIGHSAISNLQQEFSGGKFSSTVTNESRNAFICSLDTYLPRTVPAATPCSSSMTLKNMWDHTESAEWHLLKDKDTLTMKNESMERHRGLTKGVCLGSMFPDSNGAGEEAELLDAQANFYYSSLHSLPMLFNNIFIIAVVASTSAPGPVLRHVLGSPLAVSVRRKNACCGNLVQTVGFAASYNPLESAVAFGQAWTSSNCGAGPIGTNKVGPGDSCWTGLGQQKANSIAWANFGDRRRDVNSTEIVSPNAFVFTNKGVEKALRIPEDSGAIDTLVELYKKGDFAALEGYETIERTESLPLRVRFTVHVIASQARHFRALRIGRKTVYNWMETLSNLRVVAEFSSFCSQENMVRNPEGELLGSRPTVRPFVNSRWCAQGLSWLVDKLKRFNSASLQQNHWVNPVQKEVYKT